MSTRNRRWPAAGRTLAVLVLTGTAIFGMSGCRLADRVAADSDPATVQSDTPGADPGLNEIDTMLSEIDSDLAESDRDAATSEGDRG
jgi:hypothetical protein